VVAGSGRELELLGWLEVGISLTRHLETRRAHGGTGSLNIEHGWLRLLGANKRVSPRNRHCSTIRCG
jgi:hypothetical protein